MSGGLGDAMTDPDRLAQWIWRWIIRVLLRLELHDRATSAVRDRLAQRIRRYRARQRAEVQQCEREIGRLARRLADLQLGLRRKPDHWIVNYTDPSGDSASERFTKKKEADARCAELKAGTYAVPDSITVKEGGLTRGRPKELPTKITGELVRRFVAVKNERIDSLMAMMDSPDADEAESARIKLAEELKMKPKELRSLTDRQRSARVHREAAAHYKISTRYVRKFLEE
jgi:hypothetical protein